MVKDLSQAPDLRLLKFASMNAKAVARISYRSLMRGKKVTIPGVDNQLMVFSIRFGP